MESTKTAFDPKVLRVTAIASLVFIFIGAAAVTVYLLYANNAAVHAFLDDAYLKLKQFFTQVGDTIQTSYQKVVSFDYQGFFEDICKFFVDFWKQIKSIFVPSKYAAALFDPVHPDDRKQASTEFQPSDSTQSTVA
jgi:hypothetical protein